MGHTIHLAQNCQSIAVYNSADYEAIHYFNDYKTHATAHTVCHYAWLVLVVLVYEVVLVAVVNVRILLARGVVNCLCQLFAVTYVNLDCIRTSH